ncbi:LysR substrate-binding domain-containing protein [Silvibacterium dinghuense]|uniref:LysR family transcriptional regulator n=1 Tax=Silvibacterium dinghuense TaxID=1560006 RepID=A0A4Q1SKK7_9BACT|nr:LysR substrate-binding domain-containing protein [Silvibacterium dinghuense]RXS98005.1 LysR family transcriptional regulator [Silvibacterium dinghuense]GGH03748.1 LysR family transcriptional regulator [Silvibacterium dinghuense]
MQRMENFRLKVFRTVADCLNFRKAAEQLHMSQPAVSQQIHALEEELGILLFDRSNNRIGLTREGDILRRYAVRMARLCTEAREALAQVQGEPSGELRLGASTTVAQYILPRLLGEFRRLHPGVTLSLTSGNTEQIVAGLLKGETALAIIEGPASSREVHKERFLKDRMVLIVPRGHRWVSLPEIEPEALLEEPLLMREPGSGSRRVVELALRRAGLPLRRLRRAMNLDSTEAILSGVEAGLGIGFVSEWAIRKEVRLGTLKVVQVRGLEMVRDLSLIRRAGPAPEGAAGAFERFAIAQAGLR